MTTGPDEWGDPDATSTDDSGNTLNGYYDAEDDVTTWVYDSGQVDCETDGRPSSDDDDW